jgi:hypothetical protein
MRLMWLAPQSATQALTPTKQLLRVPCCRRESTADEAEANEAKGLRPDGYMTGLDEAEDDGDEDAALAAAAAVSSKGASIAARSARSLRLFTRRMLAQHVTCI